MLTLYVIAAVVGSSFVLASALMGGDHDGADTDLDHGGDFEHEVDLDHGGDVDHDVDHDHADTHAVGTWLPFFSLRFWIYFAAVFGVSGSILTLLESSRAGVIFGLSCSAGVLVGSGVSLAMRMLRSSQSHSLVAGRDFEGTTGKVLVAITRERPGKVRCDVRGDRIDLVATTQEESIPVGTSVYVLGLDGQYAKVATPDGLERRLERVSTTTDGTRPLHTTVPLSNDTEDET